MEVRQLHWWFLPSGVISYVVGAAVGFWFVVKLDAPVYASVLGLSAKYLVELCIFVPVLASKGSDSRRLIQDLEENSPSIPVKLHFRNLVYPVTVFLTCSFGILFENICSQTLYVLTLWLPNQTQSLSVYGAFLNSVSICGRLGPFNASLLHGLRIRILRQNPDVALHRHQKA